MIEDTWPQYLLIRALILFLQYIGPSCAAYTAYTAQQCLLSSQAPAITGLRVWCAAETLFLAFFLWYRVHLQAEATHPPLRTKEERKKLFNKVRSEIHDPEKFLSGWFRGAKIEDIGREDLKEFLAWTFWEDRVAPEDAKELEEVTQKVEKMIGRQFRPGRGKAKSLRLTLDPIEMECRSLLWYGIIMLIDTASHLRLLWYGFRYYSTFSTSFAVFPPRPLAAATATAKSLGKQLPYWVRPHTSKTRLPVLYIHGIGVGLHPHIEFLHELDLALNSKAAEDDQVGIMSLDILQISSRLTQAIISRSDFLEQLTTVLDAVGYARFVLLSHSYGSVLSTHILTDGAMSSRIASCLLVDPVTILLHMPDVAYNFTIRQPKHANEWQLWYFASKDPGVSYTLGRHFHWSQNLLWRDRIDELVRRGMRLTASLARRDLIVDTPSVAAYLMEYEIPIPVLGKDQDGDERMELMTTGKALTGPDAGVGEQLVNGTAEKVVQMDGANESHISHAADKQSVRDWRTRQWKGEGLEVLWWNDLDHAQVFDTKERRKELVNVLVAYSKAG